MWWHNKKLGLFFLVLFCMPLTLAITVEHGYITTSNSQEDITIDSVNPDEAFVLFTRKSSNSAPNNHFFTGELLDDTTLRFDRYGTASADIAYQVISSEDISVQRQTQSFTTTNTTLELTISSVDLDTSFITVSTKLDTSTTSNYIRGLWSASFDDETTITLEREVVGSAGEVHVQVISWDGLTTHAGTTTLEATTQQATPLGVPINESRATIISSHTATNTGLSEYSVQAGFNQTHALFEREASSGNATINWFVISHDRFRSEQGTQTISDAVVTTPTINEVLYDRSFIVASSKNTGGGTTNANAALTAHLADSTTLELQKATSSQTTFVQYVITEFSPQTFTSFNCQFRESTTCVGNETLVLRAGNDTGGFNNAHVQHANQTAIYTNSLCCDVNELYNLSNSCVDEQTSPIARISDLHDAHIQVPPNDNYNYPICLGTSFGNFTCEYVNSTCSEGLTGLFSMASTEENDGQFNATNAHIAEPGHYDLTVCCQIGRAPPQTPELLQPMDGNNTVFERNVTLDWTEPFEPDGDGIVYDLQLNVTAGSCSVEHEEFGLEQDSFTTNELCVDQLYTWSVRACDIDGCSPWADSFNFTIASTLGISFINNQTTFAPLVPGQTNNTQAGPGQPLHIENTGNIVSDVELNATTPIFENAGLDTEFFQFFVAENLPGSYVSATETYTNMTSAMTTIINSLNYPTTNNDALIHLQVTVPDVEPPGERSTTLTARVSAS